MVKGSPVPSWKQACDATEGHAKAQILANRIPEIDAYVTELGIEDKTVTAATQYTQWSAAAEYRLLASKDIRVADIPFEDLAPYLGRDRMPVLEEIPLEDLLGSKNTASNRWLGLRRKTMPMALTGLS